MTYKQTPIVISPKRDKKILGKCCFTCKKSTIEGTCSKGHKGIETCGAYRDSRETSETIPAGRYAA